LPTGRIKRAQIGHKIGFQENPPFRRFGSPDKAAFGFFPEGGRRHVEKRRGLSKIKRDMVFALHAALIELIP